MLPCCCVGGTYVGKGMEARLLCFPIMRMIHHQPRTLSIRLLSNSQGRHQCSRCTLR